MDLMMIGAELLSSTPNMLELIERAGRTCYKSEDRITKGSAEEFVRMVLKRGHHSVLEHGTVTFRFICDRGVSHELVRHRLCAYSQESTRYCNYGKEKHGREITVIQPPFKSENPKTADEAYDIWEEACGRAEESYLKLLDVGVSPQLARSVLPISLKTEVVHTANVREWRHILTLRTSGKAHPQIRMLMTMVWDFFRMEWPVLVEDIQPHEVGN